MDTILLIAIFIALCVVSRNVRAINDNIITLIHKINKDNDGQDNENHQ